jgi:hypothetical protein
MGSTPTSSERVALTSDRPRTPRTAPSNPTHNQCANRVAILNPRTTRQPIDHASNT